MRFKKIFFLALYYGFARYLPPTHKNIIGKLGGKLRNLCGRNLFIKCARTANIEHMADFGKGFGIELGEYSDIGIHCHVPNNIKIGDYVMMGPFCYILQDTTHLYDRVDIPMQTRGTVKIKRRTEIGNDVWFGRQCLMIAGKHVGNHVVIGAGSVVCKDVPDCVIAAGNPIRIIRQRV